MLSARWQGWGLGAECQVARLRGLWCRVPGGKIDGVGVKTARWQT